MAIRLFNTYSRSLEEFVPREAGSREVKMYTCGPTVYHYAHIGNLRAYIFEDLLQRHLEYRGYAIERVMNLTDVDDKTIRGCRAAAISLAEFTAPFKQAFFDDLKTLRIKPASHFPAATEPEHIAKMIEMISTLVARGAAYVAEDKSVYFRIASFPRYGQLAHLKLDELRPSGRIRNDEYEKESIGDFALWKSWDEADGEVGWDSPWGRGRPGWHIECSAIALGLLGEELDLHCGGVDNIFPHHEAEIAQSETVTGRTFARYWLHNEHLLVNGQKMAKSLGNFYTLRDLLDQGFTGREVRYALLSVHYRLPLNFTIEGLRAARSALARIDEWLERMRKIASASGSNTAVSAEEKFASALDDDLNISAALSHLFDAIRETNRAYDEGNLSPKDARALLDAWDRINSIVALESEETTVPPEISGLLEKRADARLARNWVESDALRAQIEAGGWSIKDGPEGQKLSRR